MFEGASNLAAGVDRSFILILAIAVFFTVGITAFMIWTVFKYNRKKNKPARQFTGSVTLEIIWTAIPLILVLVIFFYGWKNYAPMRKVPADAMQVTAIGRMWEWSFDQSKRIVIRKLALQKGCNATKSRYRPLRLDVARFNCRLQRTRPLA